MADSPGGFPPGALVVLDGLQEKLRPIVSVGLPPVEPLDFNGAQAQLTHWNQSTERWLAITFTGYLVSVGRSFLRPLTPRELNGYDLVLGPKSVPEELARQMAALLTEKGFLTVNVIMSEDSRAEILEVAQGLEEEGLFTRLPRNFESGYLGQGGKAKVTLLDAIAEDTPADVLDSALPAQDQTITAFSQLLRPYMQETFGFDIHSRTNLMLRSSFVDLEDEARYIAPAPAAKEADAFLALMGRKRICVLHFLGPASGELRLLPKAEVFPEVTLIAEPNTMVMFLTEQYDHSFEPKGATLTLQSFFLERPLVFEFRDTQGTPVELPGRLALEGPAPPAGEQVVIVGMASRDPCGVDMHEKLWTVVRHAGCDGFLEIPPSRFDVDLYVDYEDQARAVASFKSYCRHQGHCDGIEIFDAAFFNIPEQEVYGMDPEQRLLMEVGWGALADAGYQRKAVHKDSAHLGVFVGISGSDWRDVCKTASANGVPETFIANRFSYNINLKGPSFILNTACSASLVATHAAKMHLLFPTDPLDGCVCAGISLNLSPGTWAANCAGNMLSFRGRCFTFNGSADGYGRGEGCAAMVIKPGDYSESDPHNYALLAGSHTNSDGRSASLTAPNGPAQQRLLRAVLSETELEPTEVCVYEAHGTGTSLGDPIEVGAVRKVLQRDYPLLISCSKTNLGHLEGGAGLSAFLKCVMAVMHCECAPNQHLREQNPHLDIEGWPALLLSEAQPLRADAAYVGVSGFGYGGTNSHALAYGKNVVTSRGLNPKYLVKSVIRKVRASAAPEVLMASDDYEAWDSTGVPHLSAGAGKTYHVEVQQTGRTVWREAVKPEMPESLRDFHIQGTFSSWDMVDMDATDVPGLFMSTVTLGVSGQESFQIAVDNDPDLVFYPSEPLCGRKAVPVRGPEKPSSREHAWVISGAPGARYVVELFRPSSTTTSVTWFRHAATARDAIQE